MFKGCTLAIWALQRGPNRPLGQWAHMAYPRAGHGEALQIQAPSWGPPIWGPLFQGYPYIWGPWIWGIWAMGHMAHSPYTPYAGTTVDGASPWYMHMHMLAQPSPWPGP